VTYEFGYTKNSFRYQIERLEGGGALVDRRPVTEMSTKNLPAVNRRLAHKAEYIITICKQTA
jgi:hypothetical protein